MTARRRLLKSKNPDTRRKAAEELGSRGDLRAVGPLILALADMDVTGKAVEALCRLGSGAVEPLIAALYQPDHNVRAAAAEALGELGDARAVEPLITELAKPYGYSSSRVHQAAAEALGKLGDARAVQPLIAALGDREAEVRAAAARALGELGDARAVQPLIAALGDPQAEVCAAAAEALVSLGAVDALRAAALNISPDRKGHRAAVEALARAAGGSVESLISALGDNDAEVRWAAARALGELGDKRAVEPLISAFQDLHADRAAAAYALSKLGDARAVQPLIAALGDREAEVRAAAARALGELGDARAVQPLIAALGDPQAEVCAAAAEALGELGDARAVQPLIATLITKSMDEHTRLLAARALGKLGDARAVQPLIATLTTKNADVHTRNWAAEALGKLGDKRAVDPLIAALWDDSHVGRAAAEALRKCSDARTVESLVAAVVTWRPQFDSARPNAEWALRIVLERWLSTISADILRQVTELNDVSWEVAGSECARWTSVSFSDCRQLARQELIRRGLAR